MKLKEAILYLTLFAIILTAFFFALIIDNQRQNPNRYGAYTNMNKLQSVSYEFKQ